MSSWKQTFRRRGLPAILGIIVLASAVITIDATWSIYGAMRDNRTIRALHAGHEAQLRPGAAPRAVHARALFLAWRDRTAEAEALGPRMAEGPDRLRSGYHLAIGNARMRAAYELIEVGRPDDAIPEVSLAKRAYRDALWAWPGNYDAKVNLDLAMRLVRDMPREGEDGNEDPDAKPRQVWTDLPGLPRGAP